MSGHSRVLIIGLYLNAAVVAGAVAVWLTSDRGPTLLPSAMAQQAPAPIAGGAGLFLMPGQLAQNTWGCYVMDVDRQTLMVYQYQPGDRLLRFTAARDFSNDRRMRNYNTEPAPADIKVLGDREANGGRVIDSDK